MSSLKSDQVKYTTALLTYFDILGFQEIIERESPERIDCILELFRAVAKPEDQESRELEISFINFSDSVVRAVNVESTFNKQFPAGILFYELLGLIRAQADLVCNDVLVRGAVTIGDLVTRDDKIFGPALVRAYKLESEVALYPRIIVGPEVFRELRKNKLLRAWDHNYVEEREYVSELVRRDVDGVYYLDYLWVMHSEVNGPDEYIAFLAYHRDLVIRKSSEMSKLDSRSAKLSWLAGYHNSTIDRLGLPKSKKQGLRIPQTKLPMNYPLISWQAVATRG